MNLALHKNRHNHREAPEPPQRLRWRSPEVHHGVRQGERCLGGNGQKGDPQRAKTSRHLRWLQELLGSLVIPSYLSICILYLYMVLKNFNGSSIIHFFFKQRYDRHSSLTPVCLETWDTVSTRLTLLTLVDTLETKTQRLPELGEFVWVLWKQPEWVVLWSVFWFLSESFFPNKTSGLVGLRWICQGAIHRLYPQCFYQRSQRIHVLLPSGKLTVCYWKWP